MSRLEKILPVLRYSIMVVSPIGFMCMRCGIFGDAKHEAFIKDNKMLMLREYDHFFIYEVKIKYQHKLTKTIWEKSSYYHRPPIILYISGDEDD